MKMPIALARAKERFPDVLSGDDPVEQLAACHRALNEKRDDIAALQVLAHSYRAKVTWAKARGVRDTTSREHLKSIPLVDMTDAQLTRRAGMGGSAAVRAEINAEILRRRTARPTLPPAFGKEPNPPLAADDEADDRL